MVNYLIASNIIFFLATIFSGGFTLSNLLRWGAKFGPLIANGEWQRLLICIFLHGNLWHLFSLICAYYLDVWQKKYMDIASSLHLHRLRTEW